MALSAPLGPRARRWLPALVFVAITAVLFARPLFGGESLLATDIVDGAAPWKAEPGAAAAPANPLLSDTVDVHTHFAAAADDVRSGSATWWDRSVGGGIPTLKAGFSPLLWLYLLVPAWYAPGLVAAVRTLVAAALTYGFLRELRAERAAATVAGVAYALSGFMIGWAGWPQSNVAAFLPGLFWAVERVVRQPRPGRAVPVALAVAAMTVSNFPLVVAYGLLGAGGYGVWRLWTGPPSRQAWRAVAVAAWGVLLGLLLSSLHLLSFGEYFAWADTRARESIPPDSSIGGKYLLSIPFPRPFGSEHSGEPFWGEGQNWVETQSYAGLAVVALALVALVTRTRRRGATGDGATRGHAVRAMWGLAIAGAWISYVGGPLTDVVQSLPLLGQNSVGRARVVVNLALAVLAGLGVQAWVDARRGAVGIDLARGVRVASAGTALVGLFSLSFIWSWASDARDRGIVVETLTALWLPVLALVAVVLVLWRHRPGAAGRANRTFGALVVSVVAVELLVFALPVLTSTDRSRADLVTPAHAEALSLLDPGERMAADGRTFFANSAQVTGLDDARGHLLTPAGWRSIYRAVDPDHFRPPGSVTNPWFDAVDPASPALDRLAVGVWAADPSVPIAGARSAPGEGDGFVLLGDLDVVVAGGVTVPEGGLRAITVRVVPLDGDDLDATGVLRVRLTGPGVEVEGAARLDLARQPDGMVDVGLVGVDAEPGTTLEVRLVRDGPAIRLAARADGVLLGTVAADDGLRLVRSTDVALYERPEAAAARIVHAVVERDGPVDAGTHAAALRGSSAIVPVGSSTGLPATVPAGASGEATVVRAEGGTVAIDVTTSHAALVVVSQVDYPGWSATVDGEPAVIVRTDDAFPGVVVPAGIHQVTLRYRPTHLTAALWLTGLGAALVLATWAADRAFQRRLRTAAPTLPTKARVQRTGERVS